MFRSLSGKLTIGAVTIFSIIIIIISAFDFNKTKNDVTGIYQGIQAQTLESAYRSIMISMGDEAQQEILSILIKAMWCSKELFLIQLHRSLNIL